MQLGSHPPEICLERGAFCYIAGLRTGAHLSEFPKGPGVGDGKIESTISSLKLVLGPSRVWRLSLGCPDARDCDYLHLEDCRSVISVKLSRQRLSSLFLYLITTIDLSTCNRLASEIALTIHRKF